MEEKKMVFEKVVEIITKELNVKKEEIKMETSLTDDLGADSLDAVELIMSLEDEFGVKISDEKAQTFKTVGDIVKHLEENK
jgi:acyl carrier protein